MVEPESAVVSDPGLKVTSFDRSLFDPAVSWSQIAVPSILPPHAFPCVRGVHEVLRAKAVDFSITSSFSFFIELLSGSQRTEAEVFR